MYFGCGLAIYIFIIQLFGPKFSKQIQDMIQKCSLRQKKLIEWMTFIGLSVLLLDRILFTSVFLSKQQSFIGYLLIFLFSYNINFYVHSFTVYSVLLLSFYFFASNLIESMENCRNPLSLNESVSQIESALKLVFLSFFYCHTFSFLYLLQQLNMREQI